LKPVIINQRLSRELFGGDDPINKNLRRGLLVMKSIASSA
jgi:hypothetical protein